MRAWFFFFKGRHLAQVGPKSKLWEPGFCLVAPAAGWLGKAPVRQTPRYWSDAQCLQGNAPANYKNFKYDIDMYIIYNYWIISLVCRWGDHQICCSPPSGQCTCKFSSLDGKYYLSGWKYYLSGWVCKKKQIRKMANRLQKILVFCCSKPSGQCTCKSVYPHTQAPANSPGLSLDRNINRKNCPLLSW